MATGRCPYGEEWGRGGVAQTGGRDLCPALRAGKIPGLLLLSVTEEGVAMRRPVGISILGGLVLLAAVILVLISIASFIVGLAFLLPFPNGGPTLPGTQLLRMRVWAYGLAVLATLVTLVYVGYTAYQRSNSGEALSVAAILTLGIVGVIFVYLLAASRAFRRPVGTA